MSEGPRPFQHLARAFEELASAALDAVELLGSSWSQELKPALIRERERWSQRALDDPSAAKVHEVFDLILALLGEIESAEPRAKSGPETPPGRPRRAPRRPRVPREPGGEVSR